MSVFGPRTSLWEEACAMLDRAERLQRQFFRPTRAGARSANWEPPVDILETEQHLWIIAALPGVHSQDLEITIEPDALIIAGRRHWPVDARGVIHRLEIPYGRFERRIPLPPVRLQLAGTELASGCLAVKLAK